MGWNKKKIENHIKAAQYLNIIKDKAFEFIGKNKNVTEYEVRQFILKQFKNRGMNPGSQYNKPIVAFQKNTSHVHYYPKKQSHLI